MIPPLARRRRVLGAGLLAAALAAGLTGCSGSSSTTSPTPAAPAPATTTSPASPAPAATTSPATTGPAPTTAGAGAADRFSALPQCNRWPSSVAGTFTGSAIQVTPTRKAADTWSESVKCLLNDQHIRQPVELGLSLYTTSATGSGTRRAATALTGLAGTPVTGLADQATWSAATCTLTVRAGNLVVDVAQLTPASGCRTEVERLARAYAGLNLR